MARLGQFVDNTRIHQSISGAIMRDNDDLGRLPPMVPERDDVDSHLNTRKAQGQDIVMPARSAMPKGGVSTPLKLAVAGLFLAVIGGGVFAYLYKKEADATAREAELRISDLERRLNLVGDSAEESTLKMIERMDFNFSEIDKLWAARRVINGNIDDLKGEIARLKLNNDGQDESIAQNAAQFAAVGETLVGVEAKVNSLANELAAATTALNQLDNEIGQLDGLRGDLESIRAELNSGDSTVLGLAGRLEYVEQSMESVNAYRLQVNDSLFRLQQNVESLQSALRPAQ